MTRFKRGLTMLLCALCVVTASPGESYAQKHGDFGLGVMLGDPTGLNAKLWLGQDFAVDFGVGFSFLGGEHLHIQADFLWHFDIDRFSSGALDLYLGVGPKLGIFTGGGDGVRVGVRAPLGIAFELAKAPFDFFLEVAAGLWLIDDVDFDLDAAIGFRYWF